MWNGYSHVLTRWLHVFVLQAQQGTTRVGQPIATRKATATAQPQTEEPPSPASSTSSSEAQDDMVEEKEPLEAPKAPAPATVSNALRSTVTQPVAVSSKPAPSNDDGAVPIEAATSSTAKEDKTPLQDTVKEGTIPVTRARLRRTTRASSNR